MSEVRVGNWMHHGVITCQPETPVAEVAATMDSNDISALVVVNQHGAAVGVISRTDLINARSWSSVISPRALATLDSGIALPSIAVSGHSVTQLMQPTHFEKSNSGISGAM